MLNTHPLPTDTRAMLLARIARAQAPELLVIRGRELADTPGLSPRDRNELDVAIDHRFAQLNAEVKPAYPAGRWSGEPPRAM